MAGLTLKDFRGKHGDSRIIILLEKLIEGQKSPFTTVDGKQQPFNKVTYPDPKTGRLTTKNAADVSDSADIFNVIKTGTLTAKNIQLSFERNNRVTNLVPLSDVMKTEEFGGKANKGDMAEIVFSAAIVCRFMNKNQAIIESDVIDLIKMLNDTDTHQMIGPLKSQNKNPKIVDEVWWEINSAMINVKALKNPRHFKNLRNIISSSVKYANSSMVANNAKLVYENDRFNKIVVKAIGTLAQNDTKVDVYVEIDGQRVNINISLKADNAKQFGQVGGSSFDKQQDLWGTLIGINIPPAVEKKYYDLLKTDGPVEAIASVYQGVVKEFNKLASTNPNKLYDSLSDGITYFGTRNEKNVDMVQLTKKEAMVYQFTNLRDALRLKGKTLKAVYVRRKNPEVQISDSKTGSILVTIRLKTEKEYVRNYIEKGKLMTELVALVAV